MKRWALHLDLEGPALLWPGRGTGWWWPGRPVVADARRVWILDGSGALPLALPDVEQVGRDGEDLVAIAGRARVRISADGVVRENSGRCRPTIGGSARVWVDDGFVYRAIGEDTTAVDVHREREQVVVGPNGALLAGIGGWTRGGPPGRSPRPLPRTLLASPVRWSDDGRSIAGLDEDEQGVVIDLGTGSVEEVAGTPIAVDTWLVGSSILHRGVPVRHGICEASAARRGDRLAGPGGRLWSLATGRPVGRRGAVALGATVGTPFGFVTVDWATHRGWTVGRDGSRRDPFQLKLDPDDTVVAGCWDDGAVHLETALGERFRVVDGRIEAGDRAVDPPDDPTEISTPAGPFAAGGTADVGGFRFAWNDDGWLLAWPEDHR